MKATLAILLLSILCFSASADEDAHIAHRHFSTECEEMTVLDVGMGMCMPLPMAGMPMKMLMIHGNIFGTYINQSGPRGTDAFAAPHMFMIDAGTSIGDRHYLNLDFMGTFEKWTLPKKGYPLLLQVGEHAEDGSPFIDAQHPHSSPIMGLTLSDTIKLDTGGEQDHLKIFFAPRGESTDGPVAFMHRVTGMVNPDAPLGHHLAQDVGHITSTVLGASLKLGRTRIEASTFHGSEPEPTKVDLPMGTPNSYAARLIGEFNPAMMAMISAAYIKEPEHDDPTLRFVARYSASVYTQHSVFKDWTLANTFIIGHITKYDHVTSLTSFGEEFLLRNDGPSRIFSRLEALQRTSGELGIPSLNRDAQWVFAVTGGYTHILAKTDPAELGLGASFTHDFLPTEFKSAYGGDPWTAKVFLQLSGMKMWDL